MFSHIASIFTFSVDIFFTFSYLFTHHIVAFFIFEVATCASQVLSNVVTPEVLVVTPKSTINFITENVTAFITSMEYIYLIIKIKGVLV